MWWTWRNYTQNRCATSSGWATIFRIFCSSFLMVSHCEYCDMHTYTHTTFIHSQVLYSSIVPQSPLITSHTPFASHSHAFDVLAGNEFKGSWFLSCGFIMQYLIYGSLYSSSYFYTIFQWLSSFPLDPFSLPCFLSVCILFVYIFVLCGAANANDFNEW